MSEPSPSERSEAGVGFAATTVGLLIALAVFPDDPSPSGALTIPAIVLSGGILLVPILNAIRRSPRLLFPLKSWRPRNRACWKSMRPVRSKTICAK